MAFNTKIVTVANIVEYCIPDASFDTEVFTNYILPAQRQYLRELLGETYYDTILTSVETGAWVTEDQTLYDNFIRPMICWYVLYDAMPQVRNKITSQGIMVNDTEFSQQSSREDYGALRNSVIATAERWKKDLKQYIDDAQEDNSSAYPNYDDGKDESSNKYGFILV
jgi:hypothetical protein